VDTDFADESVCLMAMLLTLWTTWWHYILWQAVQFMHGNLFIVSNVWRLSAPLAICSQLQFVKLVSSMLCHGAVYFRAACISLRHVCEIWICYKVLT
jgi:hypothetical protein